MNWTKLAIATAAGTALLGASSAFAHQPWHHSHHSHGGHAHGWHAKHKHHHYRPRPVVVYAPPPYYYYAPPRAQVVIPGPVIYGRIPVNEDVRVSFGSYF